MAHVSIYCAMATIHKEIEIERSAAFVWDAIRDVGAIHKRLVPGFVVDCKLEQGARIVTFGNGIVARELIVSIDDEMRRHCWSARTDNLVHHNASVQVFGTDQDTCRVVWIADLLPNEAAPAIDGMIQQALQIMKRTLESA